jgi:pimeloyl-ACP methyl ester carboxylesterase
MLLIAKGTLVLVHGAGGGGWEWDPWKPVCEKAGWRFVAPDLIPVKDGGLAKTTFDDYLAQVRKWATDAREKPVVLIGASMGGALALKAAESVSPAALVLVNSVPPAGVGSKRPADPYPEIMRWANGPLQETRDAMPDSDEKMIQKAWKRWRDESGTVMNALRAGVAVRKPSCPTLVLISEKDTDVSPETSLALTRWAGADMQWYQGMSHVGPLMSTRAEEVAAMTLNWLENRLSRR